MPQKHVSTSATRFGSEAGIAIGPILFVIALLGILAAVMSAGGNSNFSTASVSDRVSADIASQANLIRTKINECNIKYGTNQNYDGYPESDTSAGTLVSAVNCDGDPSGSQNLWTGIRATVLPPPTTGFGPWYYINTNSTGMGGTATGGRCIWLVPNVANPSGNIGIVGGLTNAANKFSNATTYSANTEVIYNPTSASQKFVMWITMPTGTPDSNCLP